MQGWKDLQWYDSLRILTALLAAIVMYRLAIMYRSRRMRERLNTSIPDSRLDDFFWVLSATMFVLLEQAIEIIGANVPLRGATLLNLMIAFVVLRATQKPKEPLGPT